MDLKMAATYFEIEKNEFTEETRESTYFYPKVITGLVINDLKPQS